MAIDGNSLVHRSYHAQARTAALGEGLRLNWAVRGLLTQLVAAVDRIQPTVVVVGFDDPDRSSRRERWPQYKANRTEKLETLVAQLLTAADVLRTLGVAVIVPAGLEADDVLASTAAATRAAGGTTTIVTSDRDSFALIDETTSVLRIINGGVEASPLLNPQRLMLLLGVRPEQYRDFAALRGDPSDNLPGVRGIGPQTAAALLAKFGSARAAFDDLAGVTSALGAGVGRRLSEHGARDAWELNCQVMAMHTDIALPADLFADTSMLPLGAETVGAVYRAHELTWTVSDALRVLAGIAPESPVPPRTITSPWANPAHAVDPWQRHSQPTPRRTAPRTRPQPVRPKVEQLSLF
jgi:DNA polymerase-1